MNSSILFGVGPSVYQNVFGATAALRLAPVDALGAELPAVGEAIKGVDRKTGNFIAARVKNFRTALGKSNEAECQKHRAIIGNKIRGLGGEKWSQVLQRLPSWATSGGLFATPPFAGSVSNDLLDLAKEIGWMNLSEEQFDATCRLILKKLLRNLSDQTPEIDVNISLLFGLGDVSGFRICEKFEKEDLRPETIEEERRVRLQPIRNFLEGANIILESFGKNERERANAILNKIEQNLKKIEERKQKKMEKEVKERKIEMEKRKIDALWEPYKNYPEVRGLCERYHAFKRKDMDIPWVTNEGAVAFLQQFVAEVGTENSAKVFTHFPNLQMWFGYVIGGHDQYTTALARRRESSDWGVDEEEHLASLQKGLQESFDALCSWPNVLLELVKIVGPNAGEIFADLQSRMQHFDSGAPIFFNLRGDPVEAAKNILSVIEGDKMKERLAREAAEAMEKERAEREANPLHEANLREKSDQELENIIVSMGRKNGAEQLFDPEMTSYYDAFAPEFFPVLEELRQRGQHGQIASLLTSHPKVSPHHSWSCGNLTAFSFCRPCKRTVYEFVKKYFDEFKTNLDVLSFFIWNDVERREEVLELLAQQGGFDTFDDLRSDSGSQDTRHKARDFLDREVDRIEKSKILLTIGAYGGNLESRLKAVAKLEILGRTREGSRRNLKNIATGADLGDAWSRYKNDTVIAAAKAALARLSQEGENHG